MMSRWQYFGFILFCSCWACGVRSLAGPEIGAFCLCWGVYILDRMPVR